MDNIKRFKILLSSGSPRRKQLLEAAGYKLRVQAPNIKEIFPNDLSPDLVPSYLSRLKAEANQKERRDGEIIVAADSIVILDERILGKPTNRLEAQNILASLSATSHRVVTGVTLLNDANNHTWSTTSVVHFNALSAKEINYYIDTFQPYDKAGAYGIQDWIGACKVKKIEGSYSNIMGLPMAEFYHRIQKHF